MTCRGAQRRIPQFVDGSLRERVDARVSGHLANCRACDQLYSELMGAEVALRQFGEAARLGLVQLSAPRLPDGIGEASGGRLLDWLYIPTPLWAPVATAVTAALLVAAVWSSPDRLGVTWGDPKSAPPIEGQPLGSRAMLEFLVAPDPADAGRLAASVASVEEFLEAHPEDLAMRAKVVELYEHQLAHPEVTAEQRAGAEAGLATSRHRLRALIEALSTSQGDR